MSDSQETTSSAPQCDFRCFTSKTTSNIQRKYSYINSKYSQLFLP